MMSGKIISGIQQIGIGVSDVQAAFKWYRQNFGMSVPVFEENSENGEKETVYGIELGDIESIVEILESREFSISSNQENHPVRRLMQIIKER